MLLATALSGCSAVYYDIKSLFDSDSDVVDAAAVAKYWDGPRIGPGMRLDITIGTATTPPKEFKLLVDQNGDITIPYLLQDPVACDGLTLEAMKQKLVKAYSVYLRQPQVVVSFGPYDAHGVSPWGTVTVMGEVGTQGPVNMPPTMDLTVTKVLQLAGGLKPFADKTRIVVTRCDKDGKQSRIKVDLREIGEDGRFDRDILLKAGDVIFVPETWY
ncbi:MAG: polysaccharide export protein [Kiritimatiellae bacterium]|nr:polysaccharide export protein [Kiritimatiellia bacterium]MBR4523534.1 polysaccharide export protein [Kiritimatiellia bacterium]